MLKTIDISTTTGVTGALIIVSIIYWYAVGGARRKNNGKVPPALPRLPFVGSLPFLSGLSKLHICLTEKSKSYGKIYSMMAGSRYMVVLSGHELIREALVKNSLEFSGRGEIYVEKYIWPDHGKGVIFIGAGETHRRVRTNCITVLKNFGFGSRSIMEQKIQAEVSHLVEYVHSMKGQAWYPAYILEHSTMNVIYNLMFSKRFPHEDKVGRDIAELSHKVALSIDAIHDIFPVVTKLPNVQRGFVKALKMYSQYMEFCESEVEKSINSSDSGCDNFVQEYLKITGKESFDKREMAVIVRDLILAGTETTSGQLNWGLIFLANNPDIQSRLQKDLDSVVPRDRLPSLEDKSRLPFMDATIQEILRFRAAAPLSGPRLTIKETNIGGYDIPAGTEIMVNLWSANMDPEVWQEPEKFNPDRFLNESREIINKELMISFSHGKRSCLGEILARQEMFLFLAALVQQFNILPPEGEVKVKDEMRFARTLTAVEHTIRLVPRN